MLWKRKKIPFRRPVGVLLAGLMILGTTTTVQAPRVETEEIIVGASETAVQGVEQKAISPPPMTKTGKR